MGISFTRKQRRKLDNLKYMTFNVVLALQNIPAVINDFIKLSKLRRSLRKISTEISSKNKIPPIFHFVVISETPEELPYYTYIAMATAMHYNPGWHVIIHSNFEPTGPYWAKIVSRVQLNLIPRFTFFGIAQITHPVHKTDVVRLLALREIGGVYLDNDTLTARSFEPLQDNHCVMAIQGKSDSTGARLCSATILARRKAKFLRVWGRGYNSFRSIGADRYWDYQSGQLPLILASYHPDDITILPFDRFFYPLWSNMVQVLLEPKGMRFLPHLSNSFCFHLWGSFNLKEIEAIDESFVLKSGTIYSHFAMPAILEHRQ